jgi:hypothetical protein
MQDKLQTRLQVLQQQSQEAGRLITEARSNLERLIGNQNALLGAIEVTNEYIRDLNTQDVQEPQKDIVDAIPETELDHNYAVMD